ncbi:MAG: FHA domain-containing protein [Myxococcota bacterium]|jgi:pSer/pThr/pTyr-binding forkhead associated (FHA) protein
MPPNPKRPAVRDVPIREEHILKADDPRPQRVPQYPSASTGARRPVRRAEEHIPTSVFDTEAADEEMQAQYGVPEAEFKPAFLYVERGPGAGQLIEVKQGTIVIGRASVSDLRLQHPSISRRHAQVRRQGEQFFVKDLGSQNGTFVNKQRIATEVEVKPGDTIAMGNALVRLRGPLEKGEKLQQTPAKANKARIETAVVARHTGSHSTGSNALKIAVFAGAVGFGLAAVLAVALVKTLSNKEPATPVQVAMAVPSSPDERSRLIDEAIKRKMAEQAAEAKKAAAEEEPAVEADVEAEAPVVKVTPAAQEPPKVAAAPVVRPAPVAVARASKPAKASKASAAVDDAFEDESDEDAAPAKASPAAKRTQILASYEKGNAEASLAAAKAAGDKELVDKLSRFISSYDAANDAMMANNGTAAIMNFQKALQLDEQLSSGWGKYGAEIRRQLSNLYVLVGLKFVSDGQAEKGKQAFQAALKHDPNNQRAKAQLDKLGAAAKSPDDAFEEDAEIPAAPRKAVKPKAAASAIDDAFGD